MAHFGQVAVGSSNKLGPAAAPDLGQEMAAAGASEMYRSQGNEAFKDGKYEAALNLYTKVRVLGGAGNISALETDGNMYEQYVSANSELW
jgi:hypothetical protein